MDTDFNRKDLRRAAAPDLSPIEFKDVREVRIVLAYNKDEDQAGIHLYTSLTNSLDDIYKWLQSLRSYLLVRRAGAASLPFIEGYNNLDLVFEFVATSEKPPEFCDQSSMLLLCLLEFCFSLEPAQRNELIALYYREIVLGQDSYGAQMKDRTPIDLMGWFPPEDWAKKVFTKSLSDEGESQTVEFFESPSGKDGSAIAVKLEAFIKQSRTARKTELPEHIPISAVILACLKHRSPLPAEIWRRSIFEEGKQTQ